MPASTLKTPRASQYAATPKTSPSLSPNEGAKTNKPDWSAMLDHALNHPGTLSAAYRLFHRYSAGNCALLAMESVFRGEALAPVSSYSGWKKLGYQVKKGARAWAMVMPITVHTRADDDEEGEQTEEDRKSSKRTVFTLRNHWFTFNQVEPGPDAQPLQQPETPEWSLDLACQTLGIARRPFDEINGGVQGYACSLGIAINPLAKFPVKTGAHELAHVLLGHIGDAGIVEHETLDGAHQEAEAEATAYIVASMLGLGEEALSSSRAYIQGWLSASSTNREQFAKRSAARIFKVANQIIKAGSKAEAADEADTE